MDRGPDHISAGALAGSLPARGHCAGLLRCCAKAIQALTQILSCSCLAMDRVERPLLPHPGIRHRRSARPHLGKYVTEAEVGSGSAEVPERPASGVNTMNYFTVSIATPGLVKYVMEKFPSEPGL